MVGALLPDAQAEKFAEQFPLHGLDLHFRGSEFSAPDDTNFKNYASCLRHQRN